jgi:hypothetical protein
MAYREADVPVTVLSGNQSKPNWKQKEKREKV